MENNTNGVRKPLSEQTILPVLVKAVLVHQTYERSVLQSAVKKRSVKIDLHHYRPPHSSVHQQLGFLLRTFTRELCWWRREAKLGACRMRTFLSTTLVDFEQYFKRFEFWFFLQC